MEVHKIFMNQVDIRIILNNLPYLKKHIQRAEFRVNRDQLFKEINHPFFHVHYKDKEMILIGTEEEIQEAQ